MGIPFPVYDTAIAQKGKKTCCFVRAGSIVTAAYTFRGGGALKDPYTRLKARS
jgi:hypothetical protein